MSSDGAVLKQGYHSCSAFGKFCREVSCFSCRDCDLFGPCPQRVCGPEIETGEFHRESEDNIRPFILNAKEAGQENSNLQ